MIFEKLRIFSQNVRKNNFIINTILEVYVDFNIIFIQEPSWHSICFVPSNLSIKDELLIGIVNYSNWLTVTNSKP